MKNSVFIALLIMNCAYQIWMVSGINRTESDQSQYSNARIFQCIEILYDKQFCNVCSLKKNAIKLNKSEILASLMPYDYVRYDEDSESIISSPSCSGCVTEKSLEHMFIEYVQSNLLNTFFGLTLKSHHTKVNHVRSIHELYRNITNRFDETKKWCMTALGIAEHYDRFKNTTVNCETESSVTNSEAGATTNHNDEKLVNQTNDNKSSSTTLIPEPTIVYAQNVTSNMRNIPSATNDQTPHSSDSSKKSTTMNEKNRILLHDLHFLHSVTNITIVSLILFIILIISTTTKRKNKNVMPNEILYI